MNLFAFDFEVFNHDWIVVFRNPESSHHTVIHNDTPRLRAFMEQPDIVLFGFNVKHYDNYILRTILLGGSNIEVKRCNDWIIKEKKKGWEFPFIQFKKKTFKSFDLRDDIADKQLSLKAIEGNLKLPIVESSVDFDINRPLTKEELEEVIKYCKHDVDATVELYKARKENYIDAKVLISEMYNLPPEDGIGLTNANLCAKILGAKPKKFNDERDYVIPPNIDADLIPKEVLNYYMLIRDKSIPDLKLFGDGKGKKGMKFEWWLKNSNGSCPITCSWGGIHGANPCITVEETEDRALLNFDVASLYPNSMLNFGYCSRAMEDPEAFRKLVQKRIGFKHSGDKLRSNALKLPINTTYGAMLNRDNDLADRLAGRSVCISNQLAMTMLIVNLCKTCETIDFVNINTDGIMFTIDRKEVSTAEKIIDEWCKITKFEMERDDFKKVIQKDVNNYIGIKPDGSFKTKGGFVSLYKGGDFKTNSLQIIHKAIVDFLVKDIPPETTIDECTDIFAFQNIVKTGGSYEGAYHYVNGIREDIQKVNRVYAVKDKKYGAIVKGKWITEKKIKGVVTKLEKPIWQEDTIQECPENAFIDNENKLTVDDLDKKYYIDLAKKRIDMYLNINDKVARQLKKINQEVIIMAEKKTENVSVSEMNVYTKLLEARKRFHAAGVQKTGVNRYAEFKYFTLEDIVPVKEKIFEELGLVDPICFYKEEAVLTLVNIDNPTETIQFVSPMEKDESMIQNPIQKLGAVETYVRRYLYLAMFDIVEPDTVDAVSGKPDPEKPEAAPKTKKSKKPVSTEERTEIKEELINKDGEPTETQIKALKNGLKKLRDKDDSYEEYVTQVVRFIKDGKLTKTDAENFLIEIGEKIAE